MIFNGIDLSPYLRIKEIHGRGISPSELTLIDVPAMDGAYYSQKRRPPRVIEIEADIRASNREELRTKLDQLNAILDVNQPVPIIFPDEPDMIYYGIPESTGEGNEYTFLHQVQLTIICPDPYKYSDEVIVEFPSDVVTVTNEGTAEADPVFELEVLEPVTFAMIQNQDEDYMMIGRPVSAEEIAFEREERILHDAMNSTVGWVEGVDIDGDISGTMVSAGGKFVVSDFGEPSEAKWYGPALRRSLPELLQDFRVDILVENFNTTEGVGRVDVYLLDSSNRTVANIKMSDAWQTIKRNRASGYLQNPERTEQLIYTHETTSQATGELWNDFDGIFRFQRIGNLWMLYVGKVNPDGTHHARRIVRYSDTLEEFSQPIAQVQVHMGIFDDHPPTDLAIKDLKVWKINDPADDQVPYIAHEGDSIVFDHMNKDILLNGEPRKDLKDFGAKFFKLKRGNNQLIVHPDSFNTKLRYRKRFI